MTLSKSNMCIRGLRVSHGYPPCAERFADHYRQGSARLKHHHCPSLQFGLQSTFIPRLTTLPSSNINVSKLFVPQKRLQTIISTFRGAIEPLIANLTCSTLHVPVIRAALASASRPHLLPSLHPLLWFRRDRRFAEAMAIALR